MMDQEKIFKSDKLKIDIYVPLDVCACQWDGFMNSIFQVLTPFMKYIDFQTKDVKSEEARQNNIYGNCVLIDDKKKITSSLILKKQLPDLLKERGLI